MLFIAQSLLNLPTKTGLRLFSWNQDNTHTHPHTYSDRHSFLPPRIPSAPIPIGPWQSPSPWQYVIPDPISISSTWETTGSMWRGSHEGGICRHTANRASKGRGARGRLDANRRKFSPAWVTFSAISPILVGKHLKTTKINKTQFVIPSILHTVKSNNLCL